jgi:predicted nucleic acid-binding protein
VRFVDTNILLYAISQAPQEQRKREAANELLASRDIALSAQVLQEFYVQATRTTRADALTHQQATQLVTAFARFPVQPTTLPLVIAAMDTASRFGISYWDAAIIEAARMLGCTTVLSEDLADAADYRGVLVTNPLRQPER